MGAHPFGGFNMSGTDSKAGGPDYLLLFTQAKSIAEKKGFVSEPPKNRNSAWASKPHALLFRNTLVFANSLTRCLANSLPYALRTSFSRTRSAASASAR